MVYNTINIYKRSIMSNFIYPRRLVMIQLDNNCMFCNTPKGGSYTYYVCIPDKLGYISCQKCRDAGVGEKAVLDWNNAIAFGRAKHLKDKKIKVKRSEKNGKRVIEDGWILDYPITRIEEGNEMIHCYNVEQNISKWCYLDEILELNK
jgi:hypothetical protein